MYSNKHDLNWLGSYDLQILQFWATDIDVAHVETGHVDITKIDWWQVDLGVGLEWLRHRPALNMRCLSKRGALISNMASFDDAASDNLWLVNSNRLIVNLGIVVLSIAEWALSHFILKLEIKNNN